MDPRNLVLAQPLSIVGIRLNVADVSISMAFYGNLGFTTVAPGQLSFAAFTLELVAATGAAYPENARANDPWFQHFAIAVGDIARAATIAMCAGAAPISRGGPQRLPSNTGNVIAWKFRDPDGHPLELSLIPGSDWLRDAPADAVFLGVDHTALAVSDLATSQKWFEARGFYEMGRSRNQGAEQDRLDGLDGVVVDIVALTPPGSGPHVELLCYHSPPPAPRRSVDDRDIAATVTLVTLGNPEFDPDNHRVSPYRPQASASQRG